MLRERKSWRKINELMQQFEWEAAERLLLQELAEAERQTRDDQVVVAQCHSSLGNAAEAQHRVGDAFRHWSRALDLLNSIGLTEVAEGERLRRLIRRWHETPRVWVSYAHRDEKRVERVVRKLRRAKITVTYDKKFSEGHSIQRQILAAISQCPKGVVFWSQASRRSEWVKYEIDILKRKRREDLSQHAHDNIVIFYCLGEVPPEGDFSDDLQIIESKLGFIEAADRLVQAIKTSEVLTVLG